MGYFLDEIKSGVLRLGSVTVPVFNTDEKMKVPDILFYENSQVRSTHTIQACTVYVIHNVKLYLIVIIINFCFQ